MRYTAATARMPPQYRVDALYLSSIILMMVMMVLGIHSIERAGLDVDKNRKRLWEGIYNVRLREKPLICTIEWP
jgi:hypothetical protein